MKALMITIAITSVAISYLLLRTFPEDEIAADGLLET